jgi:hypothetical protein
MKTIKRFIQVSVLSFLLSLGYFSVLAQTKPTTTKPTTTTPTTKDAVAKKEEIKPQPDPIPTRKGDVWVYSGLDKLTFQDAKPFRPILKPKTIKLSIPEFGRDGKPFIDPVTKKPKFKQKDSTYIEETKILAAVSQGEDKWGYIDRSGKNVTPFKYYIAYDFTNNFAIIGISEQVKVEDEMELKIRYGIIDENGREVVAAKYDALGEPSEGVVAVTDQAKGRTGFIDMTGKLIVDFKYTTVQPFHEGLAAVELDGKWGFINKQGVEIIPRQFEGAHDFSDGLARVYKSQNQKWGFIDKTGKEIIQFRYQDSGDNSGVFQYGMAKVRINNLDGWVDKTGVMRIQSKYQNSRAFSEKLAAVQSGGKWGFIDVTGKLVIPHKYSAVEDFHDGLTAFKENGTLWGFIDPNGRVVIPARYSSIETGFIRGIALVAKGDKTFYVDKTGKEYITSDKTDNK